MEITGNKAVMKTDRTMIPVKCKLLAEKSVLISFAILRKFIRKYGPEWKLNVTDFCAKTAMIIMWGTHFANFVSKYIRTMRMKRTIQSGWGVTSVNDGYISY